MDAAQFARVCDLYNLGELVTTPLPVSGGLLHRLWHLTTTSGQFAVKELNPYIMRRPNIRDEYQRSEAIAARMATAGVPAVIAIASAENGDGTVQDVGNATVMVYDWIDAAALTVGAVTPVQASLIGEVVGRMHSVRLDMPNLPRPSADTFGDWNPLLEKAEEQVIPWAQTARSSLPLLIECSRAYEAAIERLNGALIVSHRDLDIRNMLWRDPQSPVLIDWESAGLANPTMEIVGMALYWSGCLLPNPNEAVFAALLTGYRSAYRDPISASAQADGLVGVIGNVLNWLRFNMQRSVGETTTDAAERALGTRETTNALAEVKTLWSNFDRWNGWLAAYLQS